MSTKFEQKPKAIGSHCKWCGNKEEDHLEDGACPAEVVNTGAAPGEPIRGEKAGPIMMMDEIESFDDPAFDACRSIGTAIEIASMLPEEDEVRIGLLHAAAKIWHAMNTIVAVIKSEEEE